MKHPMTPIEYALLVLRRVANLPVEIASVIIRQAFGDAMRKRPRLDMRMSKRKRKRLNAPYFLHANQPVRNERSTRKL